MNGYDNLIGKTLEEAKAFASERGIQVRIRSISGCMPMILTADYNPSRINLHMNEDLVVTKVSLG